MSRIARLVRLGAVVAAAVALVSCSAPAATPPASTVDDATPRPPANEIARLNFVKSVLAGDMTYHATFEGEVFGVADSLPVKGSLDVAGSDYQLVAVYPLPPVRGVAQETRFAIRYVDGAAYVRIDDGDWTNQEDFPPGATNNPFAFIAKDTDVRFTRTETVDGVTLHHVEFDRSQVIGLDQIQAEGLTNEELTQSTIDVALDGNGNPVSGVARIEGQGRISRGLHEIIVQVNLEFSKVGADIVIAAP